MSNFIEKYRLVIGIILILIITSGAGVLLWQKQSGKIFTDSDNAQTSLEKENQDLKNKIAEIDEKLKTTESGQVKSAASPLANATGDKSALININTADEKALDTLPGIGPAKAKAIISYRESKGNFKTTQDIIKVSGIGQSTFDKMKDMITVGN